MPHPCGGKGTCKKCKVTVNGKEELSCRYVLTCDATVTLGDDESIHSVLGTSESGDASGELCLCLDIGSTTLALALVSIDEKKTVKAITAGNPQRAFGSDVMSRIEYCMKNGVDKLNSALIEKIGQMIRELLSDFGIEKIEKMFVAGNTTMLHTFFGVDCSSMGASPYTPKFIESRRESGDKLGLPSVGEVISLPGISAFVGADIVAGMYYVGMPADPAKYNILIDLGTNAEIVLYNSKTALCTAAAAGPCFEGANISCGTSAVKGAVCEFKPDKSFRTIGDAEAVGICATGLIDMVAELVKDETIDETGYMDEDYVLSSTVSLTQGDVREFQLAKSAVKSALLCLIKRAGISFESVERMFIAGGFSSQMNVSNAARVGLIPGELTDRFSPINNGSLLGTIKYAVEQGSTEPFTSVAEYADISSDAYFSEQFFENMMFE